LKDISKSFTPQKWNSSKGGSYAIVFGKKIQTFAAEV
jgi:aconitate hydratase 2/2-methylisocitrate dehydratase